MRAVILLSCFALGGCAVAAKVDARNEYQASAAQYKSCLAANASAPQHCEGLRLVLETDERKYNNLSAGMNGNQSVGNFVIQNR